MIFAVLIFMTSSCSSNKNSPREKSQMPAKVVVDKSTSTPDWINESSVQKIVGDEVYIVSKETIRGDQRLSGCYELASFEAKNKLIRELGEEIRGAIDQAMPDISESTDSILTKVSSGKWEGKVVGLSTQEEYFERYRLFEFNDSDTYKERIDCQVRMKISKSNLNRMKVGLVEEFKRADPRINEAIVSKQVDFFKQDSLKK